MCLLNVPKTKKDILYDVRVVAYSLFLVNEEEDYNEFIQEWINLNPVYAYMPKTDEHMITYHNWCHMGHVTTLAYQFATHIDLSQYERTVLFFATMFHDFAHSFGELSDSENISRALVELEKYLNTNKFCQYFYNSDSLKSLYLKSSFVRDVYDTIRVTEYPFVHEALTNTQKVMRDIDLTMSLSPLDIFGIGLTNETKNKFGTIDRKTMAEFALSQHFYYPEIKKEIENFYDTLKV